jgi:multidrug efflux system membrane fusion protein
MRTTGLFVAAALGTLAAGCSHPQAAEPKTARPVRTQAVTPAAPELDVRYSASIEAFEQVTLSFKASGYVDDLLRRSGADGRLRAAQAGDRVTRGTVLARVRETDYTDRVNQGRARLAESEASLVKARLDLERAQALYKSDSLTKPELDSAQASFDAASARLKAADLDIQLALSALRDCALVAPATGVILERKVELGTLAGAGTVGFVVADLTSVKARFGIPDAMIASIQLGDSLAVTVDAASTTAFAGRVTAVAPAADAQSRVFDVEVTIANQDGRLRPGMIGTVAITRVADRRTTENAALTVPLTAIVRSQAGSGEFAVVVVERENATDVARVRRVELGQVFGNLITVVKGVKPGERVVVTGATLLVDGEPVKVQP